MAKEVKHLNKHKKIKLLNDRIVLAHREILFSEINSFYTEPIEITLPLIILGLNAISVLSWLLIGFKNYDILVAFFFISIVLSYKLDDMFGKKYLIFNLKGGSKEFIKPRGFKSIVTQLQIIWKNHNIDKLKQLSEWADQEVVSLEKSLAQSKEEIDKKNLTVDLKLSRWRNQNILQTLKLRSIFNIK